MVSLFQHERAINCLLREDVMPIECRKSRHTLRFARFQLIYFLPLGGKENTNMYVGVINDTQPKVVDLGLAENVCSS